MTVTNGSRDAIQFRDDPQDIREALINDSCVAPSGGDCRPIALSNTFARSSRSRAGAVFFVIPKMKEAAN